MIICSPQLGLNPKSVLGGEVFDRQILRGLATHGVKIRIILPKNSAHDKNIKNWQITEIPFAHFPAILFNFILIPYLLTLNKKEKIDVIRLHQPQFIGFAALLFRFFNPNIKILACYHKFEETKFGPFSKYFNNCWDYIVCDSIAVKNAIINRYQFPDKKVLVVHNGVPKYLKPQKKDTALIRKYKLSNCTVLLFMGLFNERKNPLFLLDVLKILTKKNPKIVLIFWGSGPLREAIIKKAKRLKLFKHIIIINPIFGPQKNKIHNLADIFLHPSTDEGFALAPLESMACAKPIIITDGYSAYEVVKSNGFRCAVNNTEKWVESINVLINDTNMRLKMGKKSLEAVHNEFNWDVSVIKHLNFLKKSLNGKKNI